MWFVTQRDGAPFVFKTDELEAFQAIDTEHTLINMRSGKAYRIETPIGELVRVMAEGGLMNVGAVDRIDRAYGTRTGAGGDQHGMVRTHSTRRERDDHYDF
jgi:hypothetical protein